MKCEMISIAAMVLKRGIVMGKAFRRPFHKLDVRAPIEYLT